MASLEQLNFNPFWKLVWVSCVEGIFYELCEISSLGFSVPAYAVPFIALLPHCPTNIPASAFYWIYAVFYWAAKGTKWEAGLAGLTGTRVRLASMGRVAWSGTSAVVGHKGTWQQWEAQRLHNLEQQ